MAINWLVGYFTFNSYYGQIVDHCCCFLYVMNCRSLLLDVDIITYYCCMLICSLNVVVNGICCLQI